VSRQETEVRSQKSGVVGQSEEHQPTMKALLHSVSCLLSSVSRIPSPVSFFWNYLREASGENDYARYRARALAQEGSAMTEEEFYLWRVRRKYSRINRCC